MGKLFLYDFDVVLLLLLTVDLVMLLGILEVSQVVFGQNDENI